MIIVINLQRLNPHDKKGKLVMTKTACFRAKNAMLLANIISNTFGVAAVLFLARGIGQRYTPDLLELAGRITLVFVPLAFIVPMIIAVVYEKSFREYLNRLRDHQPLTEEMLLRARQKLLNEPFFLIALDFIIWLMAAISTPECSGCRAPAGMQSKTPFF